MRGLTHEDKGNIDKILAERIEKVQARRGKRRLVLGAAGVAVGVYLLAGVIFGIAVIDGVSMQPTLYDRDLAFLYRLDQQYEYGDVVVLKKGDKNHLTKRVVGVPGDIIDIDNSKGLLMRNGAPVEEAYVFAPTRLKDYGVELPLTLGASEYFVLGDNRESSEDSRNFGSVEKADIVGRILSVMRSGAGVHGKTE